MRVRGIVVVIWTNGAKEWREKDKTHVDWVKYMRDNNLPLKPEDEAPEERNLIDTRMGVYRRDGVRTKHYKGSELRAWLKRTGFEVVSLDRVNYDWASELSPPTDWLSGPCPFDWIAVCEKAEGGGGTSKRDAQGPQERG